MKTTSKMKMTLRLYIGEAHTALNIFSCASNTTFVVLVSDYFRDQFEYSTILGEYIDPEIFMVQFRGVHDKIMSDYRFMGNEYCKYLLG